jgi:hypothetical protein
MLHMQRKVVHTGMLALSAVLIGSFALAIRLIAWYAPVAFAEWVTMFLNSAS